MKKILAMLVIFSVPFVGGGIVYASTGWKEPASSYGACVSHKTGYMRALERKNLPKSVAGACKSTESKTTWYSRSGVDKLVRPLTHGFELTFEGQLVQCKPGKPGASKLNRFDCVKVPTPSPSPTS
ncbi:hypothetical protein [Nonomuraea sp. NPDC050310]|uniref:hypothetical protein n=1 Tax=Nonomuraea sp. NPDC050310 TaxID=3154935 RepID=UPI0033D33476